MTKAAITLNQQQLTSILLLEIQQVQLLQAAGMMEQAKGPTALVLALKAASAELDHAKSKYLEELSRKVQLATPADLAAIPSKVIQP